MVMHFYLSRYLKRKSNGSTIIVCIVNESGVDTDTEELLVSRIFVRLTLGLICLVNLSYTG